MLTVRKAEDRGIFDYGWLKTAYSFSFADYYDPQNMGFHTLRVINEDRISPQRGFGQHPHLDMEIITYVITGALSHRDNMGNGSTIHSGDVQYMSAGSGVVHSEMNDSQAETHLLQIWILPNAKALAPRYDQKSFTREDKLNQLRLIVSGSGEADSIRIHQDVKLFASVMQRDQSCSYELEECRHGWLQMITGAIEVNGLALGAGDGLAVSEEQFISIEARQEAEFLLFDLI